MKHILTLAAKIRDRVNAARLYATKFRHDPDHWNVLCISMDTLEDTALALGEFESAGLGQTDAQKYLTLYGALQAVFLQQDSIRSLCETLVGELTNLGLPLHGWKEMRELRNLSIAHPIEMKRHGQTRRCFICRISISPEGFDLLIWDVSRHQTKAQHVELQRVYCEYKKEAIAVLETIYSVALVCAGGGSGTPL